MCVSEPPRPAETWRANVLGNPGCSRPSTGREASHFGSGNIATVDYAVINTASTSAGRLDLVLAGHLLPVIAAAGAGGGFRHIPVSPPVGMSLAVRARPGGTIDLPSWHVARVVHRRAG